MNEDDLLELGTEIPPLSNEGENTDVVVNDDLSIDFIAAKGTEFRAIEDAKPKTLVDQQGRTFDPLVHAVDKETGEPLVYKSGKKEGFLRVKSNAKVVEKVQNSSSDQLMGQLITHGGLKTAEILGGEAFKATKAEAEELAAATEIYLSTLETSVEPPPWLILAGAWAGFALSKHADNVKAKEPKKGGLISHFLQKRAEKKAAKPAEKTEEKTDENLENQEVKSA